MNLRTNVVRACALALLMGLLSAASLALGSGSTPANTAPIDEELLQTLTREGSSDLVVIMTEQADLSAAYEIKDWSERGHYVYDTLVEVANRTQAPIIDYAEENGLEARSSLANNGVYIKGGDLNAAQDLARLPGVALIRLPQVAQIQPETESIPADPEAYGWNLGTLDPLNDLYGMQAAQVWQQYGITGEGIVIANIDTGVYYQHVALDRQYRGNTTGVIGGPYDHNYNWYQPNYMPCGNGTYPCDDDSHGTGTMGIMVAETPDLMHQNGVAPDARWIACQGCDDPPYCTEQALTGCADWMLAPCPIGDDPGNPTCDPDLRPQIINNSWGGGGCDTWYEPYVEAWVAAGIFPAFAAGNADGCGTVASPGDLPPSFGVAAHFTDGLNAYAGGPSCFFPTPTCDPAAHDIDPHVNAPTGGETPSNQQAQYFGLGGTSGASPHLAGTVALIWSANPGLIGQIDATFTILEQGANRELPAPLCGKPACAGANGYPNYDFGWGYLDALAAVEMAGAGSFGTLEGTVTEAAPLEAPGDPLPDVVVTAQRQGAVYVLRDTTDPAGSYTLTPPAGTYTVTADGPQHGPATVTGVVIVTDTVTTLDFQLVPKGLLFGTVTDAETGAPLAAEVTSPGAGTTETDPDTGSYSLYLGEGTHNVIAQASNYASQTVTVTIVSGQQTQQDFALLSALTLTPWPIHGSVELGDTLDLATLITNRTDAAYPFDLSHAAGRAGDEGPILLVDGEVLDENPVAFEIALANLGYEAVQIDAPTFLDTAVPELLTYGAVIYAGTAGAAEQDHLIAYLDAGGRLLLADGSFTLYYQDTRLHRVYLQAIFDGIEEWAGPQIGLDIMAGLYPDISSMIVVYDSYAGPDGVGIFQSPGSHFTGIRTERAGYRAIFLSFDLNRIGAREPGDADETAVVRPAMLWLLGYPVTAPWYGTNVSGGVIPPHDNVTIQSQFDASAAAGIDQPGDFYAWLYVEPAAAGEIYPRLEAPVIMTVVPRPTMGQLAGIVTTDRPGGPLQADVLIESAGPESWALQSDWWTGEYGYWLEAGDYTVTVSADGYYTATAEVTISAGMTTTHDVGLIRAAPEITLSPLALDESLLFGTAITRALHVGNVGPEPLILDVEERDRGATPLPGSIESITPQGVNGAQILFDAYHGSDPDYYNDLFTDLESMGATVDIWSAGPITATALTGADILFIGDFADLAYRFDELDAIDTFVREGGGLLVSYECCDDATAPAVTKMFGIVYDGPGGTSGVTYDIYPHPTTEDVGAIYLPSRQFLMTTTITGTAQVVVYDVGGDPATAVNVVDNGKVVVVADQPFWDGVYSQADNTQFGRNVFSWLYGDVPWMETVPNSATVQPGDEITLTVTLDASAIDEPAIYHGDVVLANNDPYAPSLIVPITMTVEPTADLGRLLGTVTSNRPGGPLRAELLVEGGGAPITLYTHPATGEYDRWLAAGSYDVTVSAAGYLSATGTVVVPAGGSAVLDFELELDAPGVATLPTAVEQTVEWGMTATQLITVTNVGVRDLDFTLVEEDLGGKAIAQGEQAYAFDYEGDNFVSFFLDDPGTWTLIVPLPGQHYEGGDFRLNDFSKLYVIWGSYLFTLDTSTGEDTYVGLIGEPYPHQWMGLTSSAEGTLYGVTDYWWGFGDHESYLWTIDPAHGNGTQIAQISNAQLVSDIAINRAGEMYAVDVVQDVFLQIDPATGAGTIIGPLGFDAWHVVLDFDDDTGVLYMADYDYLSAQGHLWTINVATGTPTQLGNLPSGAGYAFLAIVADGRVGIPWLSETPLSGTVPPAGAAEVELTFDASRVNEPGAYRGNLHVESNDPLIPDLPVPVTMTVMAGPDHGQIEGVVSGTGHCDAESYPLEAQLTIESTEGVTWTTTSDPGTGYYTQWVTAGTYTVTAQADGHVSDLATVAVVAGQSTVQDFDLRLFEPCLVVTPSTYSLTLSVGSRLTQTLTVGNQGARELMWALHETTDTQKLVSIPPFEGEIPEDAEPPSILPAPAPATPPPAAAAPGAGLMIGEPAYGLDTTTFNLVHIPDTQDPGTWEVLSNVGRFYSGGDFWHGDFTKLYALDFFTNEFVTLQLDTGERTVIGTALPLPGHRWTGLTIATDGTIYGVSTECNVASALYIINRMTGETTLVGTTTSAPCLIDVAINAQGQMYAVDISSDALFRIDTATGAATAIGLLGVNANNAQSMDFEEETGILYWAAAIVQTGGELRYIDTTTGHSLSIGHFPDYTGVDCLAFGTGGGGAFWGDVPWVSEAPTTGVTPADSAFDVDVVFDATDLTDGECYTASLGIVHDDPDYELPALVPMTLCVGTPWPVFYLTKTAIPGSAMPGDPAAFTIVFGNDGSLETGITISDVLPAEMEYNWSDPAGVYDPLAHELVWSGLVLDEGARMTATVAMTMSTGMEMGSWVTNTVYLLWRDQVLSDWARVYVGAHLYLPLVAKGPSG
jgi:hypothetical protein